MSSSENETKDPSEENQETTQDESSTEPNPVKDFLDGWEKWVEEESKGSLELDYDEDEDIYSVERDERKAVVFTSEIDEDFYGESQALFVEAGGLQCRASLCCKAGFQGNNLVFPNCGKALFHF